MKLMHLSDLHLGKRVNEFSMLEDQAFILDQIVGLAASERPDAVVIAGDVYDKAVPSAEAVQLMDDFLCRLAALPVPSSRQAIHSCRSPKVTTIKRSNLWTTTRKWSSSCRT